MRTKILLLLIVVSSILSSCEKEVDSLRGSGGNYHSVNKPLTGTSTIQPGNSTATATYYYQ